MIKRAETALGNRGNRSYRPMRIKNFGSIWGLLYPPRGGVVVTTKFESNSQ
jgi:hypothetical protein